MPRKPRLPPPILRIESLSTGRELRPEFIVDELGEGSVRVIPDMRPARPLKTGAELQDEINRAKLHVHRQRLVAVGWGDKIGMVEVKPPQHVAPEGMRVAGTFKSKDGKAHALLVPLPSWRRATIAPIVDKPKKPRGQ